MNKILIILIFSFVTCFAFAQPPVPSTHGGWNYRESVESPYQHRFYNNATGSFEPMETSSPLGTNVSLLLTLACGYVVVKICRNCKIKTEK